MGEFIHNNVPVVYNGEIACYLNGRLIAKQGLSAQEVESLVVLHYERLSIEDAMEKCSEHNLKALYKAWLDVQYELQDAWKFGRNENYIKFWEVPRCTCPKMDNADAWPSGYYTIDIDCPVHGE